MIKSAYHQLKQSYIQISCFALTAGLLVSHLGKESSACETPVYRFAMYQWRTEQNPYQVFYLHSGKVSDADKKTNKKIAALASIKPESINLRLNTIDVDDKETITILPKNLRQLASELVKETDKSKLPLHIIITPRGRELYSGKLKESDIKAMTQSPVRKKVAETLAKGYAGVFVLIEGKDKKENQKAEQELNKIIKDAAVGKIKPIAVGAVQPKANERKEIDLLLIKLSRKNPAEKWLIRCLMSVEDLEDEYLEKPMMFTLFGRARAREPFIGKGILYDNLIDEVHYLISPCSCEVKEQNRGVDVISRWNWDETALKLAERFGSETGNEDLVPKDEGIPLITILPEDTTDPKKGNNDTQSSTNGNKIKNVSNTNNLPKDTSKDKDNIGDNKNKTDSTKTAPTENKKLVDPLPNNSNTSNPTDDAAAKKRTETDNEKENSSELSGMMSQIVWGIAICVVVLAAVSFIFLKPR